MSDIITEYKPVNFIRDIIIPITSPISANTTYTLPVSTGIYFLVVDKENLIASTASSQSLIITTGTSGAETVTITILGSASSTSNSLLLTLYTDQNGNVYKHQ